MHQIKIRSVAPRHTHTGEPFSWSVAFQFMWSFFPTGDMIESTATTLLVMRKRRIVFDMKEGMMLVDDAQRQEKCRNNTDTGGHTGFATTYFTLGVPKKWSATCQLRGLGPGTGWYTSVRGTLSGTCLRTLEIFCVFFFSAILNQNLVATLTVIGSRLKRTKSSQGPSIHCYAKSIPRRQPPAK